MDRVRIQWAYRLTETGESGILDVDGEHYLHCPKCGKKLAKIFPPTEEVLMEFWCKRCGPVGMHITREP